jgi:hypothetical protein
MRERMEEEKSALVPPVPPTPFEAFQQTRTGVGQTVLEHDELALAVLGAECQTGGARMFAGNGWLRRDAGAPVMFVLRTLDNRNGPTYTPMAARLRLAANYCHPKNDVHA